MSVQRWTERARERERERGSRTRFTRCAHVFPCFNELEKWDDCLVFLISNHRDRTLAHSSSSYTGQQTQNARLCASFASCFSLCCRTLLSLPSAAWCSLVQVTHLHPGLTGVRCTVHRTKCSSLTQRLVAKSLPRVERMILLQPSPGLRPDKKMSFLTTRSLGEWYQ
jgi:hypothetical protein